MTTAKSILFVCTGNIFRSPSAELCFKQYLSDNGIEGWTVGSAGITANSQPVDPVTAKTLEELGMDAGQHAQRKLTREILQACDVVVGMAQNHLEFMRSEFGYDHAVLFNDLAVHEQTSVLDIEDEVQEYLQNRPAVEEKVARTVREIHDKTPEVFKNASERFYLFSDFVAGKIRHRNGYPFITLYETPNAIAFMSVDIPYKEDGHILVIPKKRYFDLTDVPAGTLGELLTAITKVGDALRVDHGGYNILLNNGIDAGQYIMHTHFHIIPRRSGDDIRIEVWKHPPISLDEFVRLNEKLKEQIQAQVSAPRL